MNKQLRRKLQDYDRKTLQHDRKIVNLVWRMFHGEDVGKEIGEAEGKKAEYVSSANYPGILKEASAIPLNQADRRELVLRRNSLLIDSIKSQPEVAEALQKAGQAQYEFRVKVDGKELGEGEVGRVLNTCDDRSMREKVWRAQEQSLELAELKLEVVKSLNKASQEVCGTRTFSLAVLGTQDYDPFRLTEMILTFLGKTRNAMKTFTGEVLSFSGLPKLEPWDVPFYVSGYLSSIRGDLLPNTGPEALALFKRTLDAMGFGKLRGRMRLESDALDKPPFMFSVNGGEGYAPEQCAISTAPGACDYRVFVNPELSPNGLELTRAVFLESGRAIHYRAMDLLGKRDAFKWDSDCMRHAVAMLFDSLVEDEKWLRDIAGIGTKDAEKLAGLLRMKKLHMARRLAADAYFEMRLYPFPGQAVGTNYREAQELFQVRAIDYEVENRWAWNPNLAFNPAGGLSYALGYQIYESMAENMRKQLGGTLLHRDAAKYLGIWYFTGYETPWQERLSQVRPRPGQ